MSSGLDRGRVPVLDQGGGAPACIVLCVAPYRRANDGYRPPLPREVGGGTCGRAKRRRTRSQAMMGAERWRRVGQRATLLRRRSVHRSVRLHRECDCPGAPDMRQRGLRAHPWFHAMVGVGPPQPASVGLVRCDCARPLPRCVALCGLSVSLSRVPALVCTAVPTAAAGRRRLGRCAGVNCVPT